MPSNEKINELVRRYNLSDKRHNALIKLDKLGKFEENIEKIEKGLEASERIRSLSKRYNLSEKRVDALFELYKRGELEKRMPGIILELDKQLEKQPKQEDQQTITTGATGIFPGIRRNLEKVGLGTRDIGLAARATAKGVASVGSVVTDPVLVALNMLTPENYKFPMVVDAVDQLLTRIGVPEPKSLIEKRINQLGEYGIGSLTGVGLAQRAAQTGGRVTRGIAEQLSDQPGRQLTGAVGAGLGQQAAEELGEGPVGQTAGMIAGSFAGSYRPGKLRPPAYKPGEREALSRGIDVKTTDLYPPKTYIGKWAKATGEKVPYGTGKGRAKQAVQRQDAIRNLSHDFIGEIDLTYADDMAADLLARRGERIKRYNDVKQDVIKRVSQEGEMPIKNTLKAINKEIRHLSSISERTYAPVIDELRLFQKDIVGKNIGQIELNRKLLFDKLQDPSLSHIKGEPEKSFNRIYSYLKKDMANFIKSSGEKGDFNRWKRSNRDLAKMIRELKVGKLNSAIKTADVAPEKVYSLLFTKNRSEAELLYKNLSDSGRKIARASIIDQAIKKSGGLDNISPKRFENALKTLDVPYETFFKREHRKTLEGLKRALSLTRGAEDAALLPPTGVQNVPINLYQIAGNTIKATIGALSIGTVAKMYEHPSIRNTLRSLANTSVYSKEEAMVVKRLLPLLQKFRDEEKK